MWLRMGGCLTAAVTSLLAGCGSDEVPVFPVRGKVLYRGRAAANAEVVFHPAEDDPRLAALCIHGTADAEGVFELTTYRRGDGAPAGDYVVTVFWPRPRSGAPVAGDSADPEDPESADLEGGDFFQGRYGSRSASKLRATVGEQENELPPFDLK
jgi:hypothetical protein